MLLLFQNDTDIVLLHKSHLTENRLFQCLFANISPSFSGSGSGLDLVVYFAGATTGYSAKFVLKKLRLGEALKIFEIS